MSEQKTPYESISLQAVRLISPAIIRQMSEAQRGQLNMALKRLVDSGVKITDEAVLGAYRMIVQHVLPTGSEGD